MAKFTFKAGEDYAVKLGLLAARSDEIAKRALYDAADVVANKVRANIEAIPEDNFRFLHEEDQLSSVSRGQKDDLLNGLKVTPIDKDGSGWWNVVVGFDGYGSFPTKKYPKGVPNLLLARSVESGSSTRKKHPFSRPAVKATEKAAIDVNAEMKL